MSDKIFAREIRIDFEYKPHLFVLTVSVEGIALATYVFPSLLACKFEKAIPLKEMRETLPPETVEMIDALLSSVSHSVLVLLNGQKIPDGFRLPLLDAKNEMEQYCANFNKKSSDSSKETMVIGEFPIPAEITNIASKLNDHVLTNPGKPESNNYAKVYEMLCTTLKDACVQHFISAFVVPWFTSNGAKIMRDRIFHVDSKIPQGLTDKELVDFLEASQASTPKTH